MARTLDDRTVAFLLTDGFEDSELTSPWAAVEDAGARTSLVSPADVTVRGKNGHEQRVDLPVATADPADFDALVLPGGTLNSDKIRTNQQAIDFVKAFFDQNKPVASICHGPWILIEAGVVPGRTLTSTARISTDLKNAGATWVDQEVVVDGNLITSRSPRDLEAFNAAIVEKFAG